MGNSDKGSTIVTRRRTPVKRQLNPDRSAGLVAGKYAALDLEITMQEKSVVCDRFLDELLQQEQFGRIDHRMHTLLKSLQRRERLIGISKQDDRRMPSLPHGHGLQRLQSQILTDIIGSEQFLDHNHLVSNL